MPSSVKAIENAPERPFRPLSYRPKDAAAALGVSQSLVYQMIAEGQIEARKIGATTVIRYEEIEAILERRRLAELLDMHGADDMAALGTIYVVGYGLYVKIGFTGGCVLNRVAALQTACPEKLRVFAAIEAPRRFEGACHRRFAEYRTQGEWFRRSGELAKWIRKGCPYA